MNQEPLDTRHRLDTWLWAARFYKTRSLAQEAITGGKVQVNDQRAKPGRAVRIGERIAIHKESEIFHVVVKELASQRGPAKVAVTLYEETPESRQTREQQATQRREQPQVHVAAGGRPTKKTRRDMERLRWG